MVAYLFPPHGGGGVQRTVKFSKYLPHFGWQPYILTSRSKGTSTDNSLAQEIPADIFIKRTFQVGLPRRLPWRLRRWLTNWVLTVDEQVGWWPFAVQAGKQLLQQTSFSLIYSTSTPYTNHLVALTLHQKTKLPWVADFRDPWLDNFNASFPTQWHKQQCARIEAEIVEKAQTIVVVSEPMREQFQKRYLQYEAKHFTTLPNGFDRQDYGRVVAPQKTNEQFTIVYTGSFYGRQSSETLLKAILQTLSQGDIPRKQLRLVLIGATGQETNRFVEQHALSDVIELPGYLPHQVAVEAQLAADVLILYINASPGSEVVFTGKLFEYLAVEKPILALIPPGAAANLLRDAHVGTIVPPDDVDSIAAAIHTLFTQWQAGQLQVQPNRAVINQYERRHLTQKLAQLFDSLVDTHEQRN